MHVVFLRFAENRASAPTLMAAHNEWLSRGFDDGVFVLAGTIRPASGGVIIAHDTSAESLSRRVEADPFVSAGVVRAEITEIAPGRADERLAFLLDEQPGRLRDESKAG